MNMQNRKAIQLLKLLTKNELKQLERYVQSPYFNSNKKIISLLQWLKKFHPTYDNATQLTDERGFAAVFGRKKFQNQAWKNLLSIFLALVENFLAQESYNQDQTQKDLLLLYYLIERRAVHFFNRRVQHTEKQLQQSPLRGVEHYHYDFRIAELKHTSAIIAQGRLKESTVSDIFKKLDIYTIFCKLRYCASALNRQFIARQIDTEMLPLIEKTLTELATYDFKDVPILTLWHQIVLLLHYAENDYHFHTLKQHFNEYEQDNSIATGEWRQFYTVALNYCSQKSRQGQSSYLKEFFELYQKMLNKQILMVNGQMTPYRHFTNIVRAALRVGEVNWTVRFVEDYQHSLNEQIKENVLNYCQAAIYFYQKKHTEAWQLLHAFEFSDVYDNIDQRNLFAKNLYELGEGELLEAHLAAFKTFLHTKEQIVPSFKEAHQQFARILSKIYKLLYDPNTTHEIITKLKKDIQQTPSLEDREWLLEKCEELERGG